jgi:hypothetical protein
MSNEQGTPTHDSDPPVKGRFGKRLKAIAGSLVALGVISAITAYYLPGILKSGGDLLVKRAPIYYSATVLPGTQLCIP